MVESCMGVSQLIFNWRLDFALPLISKLPKSVAWATAEKICGEGQVTSSIVEDYLASQMARFFPHVALDQRLDWARSHLQMISLEMLDGLSFSRMATVKGPAVEVNGIQHVRKGIESGRGIILILNHIDRLLTAPIILARHGISSHVLTMPVLENLELSPPLRRYLLKKIRGYTRVTQGMWRTTKQSMRPVHTSLKRGEIWVILADVWRPEFTNLRAHSFFGGSLFLPTGIERLAQSTGAQLLHAHTSTVSPTQLLVTLEPLPDDPIFALSVVVQQLESDVRSRPWAWWQWGVLDHMWTPHTEDTP